MGNAEQVGFAILALALVALAGCVEEGEGPAPAEDPVTTETVDDPTDPGPLQLSLESVPDLTQAENLTLTGSVDRPARISATVDGTSFGGDEANGTWVLRVLLEPGRNSIEVSADDGTSTANETLQVTRLIAASLEVDFGGYPGKEDRTDELWFDVDTPNSLPAYEDVSSEHPGYYTAHDLLVLWEETTGIEVEYSHFDGIGYSVSTIDGAGNPVSGSAPPYWCYTMNGSGEGVKGASIEAVQAGDVVTWYLGACDR